MHRIAGLFLAGALGACVLTIVHAPGHAHAGRAYALASPDLSRDRGNSGDTFDVRVALAKAAEGKEEFSSYHAAMNQQVGGRYAATMRSCFAATSKPQTDSFTLVGDIMPDGELADVEVQPATNIASCFAAGLRAMSFPKPPRYPGRNGFPMTIEMNIK